MGDARRDAAPGVPREDLRERRRQTRGWLRAAAGHTRVKLCGMFRDGDIDALNAAQPDLCGFVSAFPRSHRDVEGVALRRLVARVDPSIRTTVVLVDQPVGQACRIADDAGIDIVQLHGHEDAVAVRALRERFDGGIIQAFRIRAEADVERALASPADIVLLDAGQGSGTAFDWSLVEGFGRRRPFILAGGLTPQTIGDAIALLRPWGVDLSSGIETDHLKDRAKMASAVSATRAADSTIRVPETKGA